MLGLSRTASPKSLPLALIMLGCAVVLFALMATLPSLAQAQGDTAAAAAPAAPSLEERIADLEAYVNNGARTPDRESKIAGPGPGHNGWLMTCAALVLFMSLPGLALFYGGLVRAKNILSVMAQCLGIAGLVTLLWWLVGYSFAFDKGGPFLGGTSFALLEGVGYMPNGDYTGWVSHNVFSMFQLMFAIITPALMVGAIAERMKFKALILFVAGWMFIVYFPLAHMVWGIDGFMNGVWNADAGIKAIDFAGGTVVHMSSGYSALVLALIVGKRKGHGSVNMSPHSLVQTMIGTGMLWVGWYGFNAGSAGAADGLASNAFMTTTLAAAAACATWPAIEWIVRGKPTVLGFCSGAVGGLVVITPAAGFVTATSAVIMGVLGGAVTYLACTKLKEVLKYDDALDTFGVHAVGGTLGAVLTGIFADKGMNPNLATNLESLVDDGTLWIEQVKAMGITVVMAVVGTVVLAYAIKATVGLRPSVEDEETGLDLSDHGERGYSLGDVR